MECYTAVKMKVILPHATWMNLKKKKGMERNIDKFNDIRNVLVLGCVVGS